MTFNNFQICSNHVEILYPIISVAWSIYPTSFAFWVFQTLYHFQMHVTARNLLELRTYQSFKKHI